MSTKDNSSGSKKKDKRSAALRATLLRQQNMNALAKAVRAADRSPQRHRKVSTPQLLSPGAKRVLYSRGKTLFVTM